jgi:hypothetical protein
VEDAPLGDLIARGGLEQAFDALAG